MNLNPEQVALSALPRELATFAGKPSPGYRQLYMMALDGNLPAEKVGGRWTVRRADLPRIAGMVGLSPAIVEPAPARRRPKVRQAIERAAA